MPQSDIKWAIDSLIERVGDYRLATQYYDGIHRLDYVPSDFRAQFAAMLRQLRMNLCPAIVGALRDRLKLTGFTSDQAHEVVNERGRKVKVDPTSDRLNYLWRRNRMDLRQAEVSNEAIKSGDGYVIVWENLIGEPIIYPQPPDTVTVEYSDDEPGLVIRAAKILMVDERLRVTLYYPDRIERYISIAKPQGELKAENFIPFTGDNQPAEIVNKFNQVPVFHFGNDAAVGSFGRSELESVIPIQDALNKMYRDTIVTADLHALPQRGATGLEMPTDPLAGRKINPFVSGDFWATASKEASFFQLGAADLVPFIAVKQSFVADMAAVTGTPPTYIGMGGDTTLSGEALKTLEGRLTSRVEMRQTAFGQVWEQVFQFAMRMMGDEVILDAVWANTTPRDASVTINNLVTLVEKLGVTRTQALRELNYSDEEIDRMLEEKELENADALAAAQALMGETSATQKPRALPRGKATE